MNYNDYIDYPKMFRDIVKDIKHEEIVWHPSEQIDGLAQLLAIAMSEEQIFLDPEQCSLEQNEDDTIIEFTFIDEVSVPTIWHTFTYSDTIDRFFKYIKEDDQWVVEWYSFEIDYS